jgi:hypothetical protein
VLNATSVFIAGQQYRQFQLSPFLKTNIISYSTFNELFASRGVGWDRGSGGGHFTSFLFTLYYFFALLFDDGLFAVSPILALDKWNVTVPSYWHLQLYGNSDKLA